MHGVGPFDPALSQRTLGLAALGGVLLAPKQARANGRPGNNGVAAPRLVPLCLCGQARASKAAVAVIKGAAKRVTPFNWRKLWKRY